jgi:hypothetical protein
MKKSNLFFFKSLSSFYLKKNIFWIEYNHISFSYPPIRPRRSGSGARAENWVLRGFASASTICLSKSNFYQEIIETNYVRRPYRDEHPRFLEKIRVMRILLRGRAQKGYFGRWVKIKSADGGKFEFSYSIMRWCLVVGVGAS